MEENIVVKQVELAPQTIYGARKKINIKNFDELFAQVFAELGQKQLQPLGPPMAFYFEEEFNPECSDIEVAVQVAEGTPGAHIVADGPHAMATMVGPYVPEAFTATYAGLMKWAEENGYHVSGAPYDKYVRGGPDCAPEEYVTEVYFPIAK